MIKHIIVVILVAFQLLTAQEAVFQKNKWSLGISHQLYSTQGIAFYYNIFEEDGENVYYPYYITAENITALYLTRSITQNSSVYLSFDYSMKDYFYRNEYHKDYTNLGSNDYDSGGEDTFKESSLRIFVGGKIFFKPPRSKKVSPYIILGIGKQITDHSSESKNLYYSYDDSENISGDDYDDYYEKIKSPIFIFGKGGSEYYLNSSISITAEMELLYQKSDAKRNYTYTRKDYDGNINYTKDYKIHRKESSINQSVKIGLNFYF